MGYYVDVTDSGFLLRKEDFEKAYKAMCDLNQRDDLKSGGTWTSEGLSSKDPRPEGLDYHPAKWFSWMDANYPAKCPTFESILTELGFELFFNDNGDLTRVYYSNKIGSEEHFFNVIAPYIADGGYVDWVGEDNTSWRWVFRNGKMKMLNGVMTYPEF